MERRVNVRGIVLTAVAVVLVVLFAWLLYNDSQFQNLQTLNFNASQNETRQEQSEYEQLIIQNADRIQSSIDKTLTGIVLYGDSYLGNGKLANQLKNTFNTELFNNTNSLIKKFPRIIGHNITLPTVNFEVQNENLNEMMIRIGAEPLLVAKKLTIPADTTAVEISLKTAIGESVNFLQQSNVTFGTVTIDGIEGTLTISSTADNQKIYLFTRKSAGSEKTIVSGTKIYIELSEKYREYTSVIFFGNNDYTNLQKYINRHKAIINHQTTHKDKYIIVCRTKANSELDTAMTEAFGYNYIRTDDEVDYPDLAEKIYFRMKTLKYLDSLAYNVRQAENKLFPEE